MTIIVSSEADFLSCEVSYSQRVIGFFAGGCGRYG